MTDPTPCPCCKLLEADRNFYRDIVLGREAVSATQTKFADVNPGISLTLSGTNNDIPIRRGRTLSSIRRQAEEHFHNKKITLDSAPATVADLTEAERQFNTALENSRNGII